MDVRSLLWRKLSSMMMKFNTKDCCFSGSWECAGVKGREDFSLKTDVSVFTDVVEDEIGRKECENGCEESPLEKTVIDDDGLKKEVDGNTKVAISGGDFSVDIRSLLRSPIKKTEDLLLNLFEDSPHPVKKGNNVIVEKVSKMKRNLIPEFVKVAENEGGRNSKIPKTGDA
ncbi:hypothetical protein PIB30_095224 [Stylosanthes scabra]|uniref:Uncharacterized protein n=1 Tax=Stylosanthes scabra TaxID=79078 RepID=A0ABU6ZUG5_9FABA|nr:hypothetical protein [Stylosanthes scabra]